MAKTLLMWETLEGAHLYIIDNMSKEFERINGLFINVDDLDKEQEFLLDLIVVRLTPSNDGDDFTDWVTEVGATTKDVGLWLPCEVAPGCPVPACDAFIHCGFIF